jgi:XTP/dITP diphosphohydrolase
MKLLCATTNAIKFGLGEQMCKRHGIELEQIVIEVDEIQSEDVDKIIDRKARAIYDLLQKPVVISDDTWRIPALNGFPGPYMKSINHWFKAEDFIRLMTGVQDRSIILEQRVAFFDGTELVVFTHDVLGTIVEKPRGTSDIPVTNVAAMDIDGGLTIAEVYAKGLGHSSGRIDKVSGAWKAFAEWYSAR